MKYLIASIVVVIASCGPGISTPPSQPQAPCTVSKQNGVSTITCSDGSSVDVSDGAPGLPGQNLSLTFVDPCPSIVIPHPELLMQIDGILYAVYASGTKIHLSRLQENTTYQTTDGRACTFSIQNGAIVE
jgi:hypothetical protein